MQKINLEKLIDLNHELFELQSLQIDDDISYMVETEGVRAKGKIYIFGSYYNGNNEREFHEVMDIDVFAPDKRIESKENFQIIIQDFDYRIKEKNLIVNIEANASGVLDQDKIIEIKDENIDLEKELYEISKLYQLDEVIDEVVQLANENEITAIDEIRNDEVIDIDFKEINIEDREDDSLKQIVLKEIEKKEEVKASDLKEIIDNNKEIVEDLKVINLKEETNNEEIIVEDFFSKLFRNKNNTTMYKMIICKEDDTYESISKQTNVSVKELREINKNQEIRKNCTIIISKK